MKQKQKFKNAIKFLSPYKGYYILLFILMIAEIGLNLTIPYFWSRFIVYIAKGSKDIAIKMLLFMIGFKVLEMIMAYLRPYVEHYIKNSINYDIRIAIYKKMLRLPIKAYDEMKMSEFMSRIKTEVREITFRFDKILVSLMGIIMTVTTVIIIFTINVVLALITLTVIPILYYIFSYYGEKLRKESIKMKNESEHFTSKVHESIIGMRDIKSLGIKKKEEKLIEETGEKLKNERIKYSLIDIKTRVFSRSANFFSEASGLAVGTFFVINGYMRLENLIAYRSYAIKVRRNIRQIARFNVNYQQILVSISRIMEIMESKRYEDEVFGEKCISEIDGTIEFKNVSFSYDPESRIFNNLDMYIKPNRKTAIIGKSGAGKSTIFNLILKFYQKNKGIIKIGGHDIDDFDEDSLRKHIAVIRQDIFLFNMSIKDNLRLAKSDATEKEIVEACKKANIHHFIKSLDSGYESIIEEGANNLSGGQKQRIAIARAILKGSKIMLFDEATSALDNKSQRKIEKAINKLKNNHTIVVVAHRLETVKNADEIIVLEKGKVSDKGRHEDLIGRNELYKEMCLEF